MNLRHLHIFQTVCEENGITKAAEKLYMTQPAVSHAISELEEELSVTLFDRISRRLYLTQAGRILLEKTKGFLEMYDDLEACVKNLESSAPLRIGSTITLANYILPGAMNHFEAAYGYPPAQVFVDNARGVEAKLCAHELDLALLEGVPRGGQLITLPLESFPLSIVCSPAHPLAGKTVALDILLKERLLLREPGSAVRDTFDSALVLHGAAAVPLWTSANSQALVQAAAHNLGLAVLPDIVVRPHLAAGTLAPVLLENISFQCSCQLAYHRDKHLSQPIHDFIHVLTKTRQNTPPQYGR